MNKLDFAGRNAIVTGGAQGIGAAIVKRLRGLRRARCAIWDLDGSRRKVDVRPTAMRSRADAAPSARLKSTLGKIDVLVNNAGIAGPNKPVVDYPVEEWKRVHRHRPHRASSSAAARSCRTW